MALAPQNIMTNTRYEQRPHALCIPAFAQGHVIPMTQLAKLLHSKGFYVTFVNSEYNHERLIRSGGPDAVKGLPDFKYDTIPDGLPPQEPDRTQDVEAVCETVMKNCLAPFRDLLSKLNKHSPGNPAVSCIVSDGVMSFTYKVAEELDIPVVTFWTTSACGFWGFYHYEELVRRGYSPLKVEAQLTDEYLDAPIDWIPGLPGIRFRDLPTFIRTTNPDDILLKFCMNQITALPKAKALLLNTFDDLEHTVLDAIRQVIPCVLTIGPLLNLTKTIPNPHDLDSIHTTLWKEDGSCLEWLDTQDPGSVVYVNYGSITVMTNNQLVEFAWGLANSNHPFLWIIRPDLVEGDEAVLPEGFLTAMKNRGFFASWCDQEKVLGHIAVGAFLTHCGWNSTLETICNGVPVLCWPFFAEQQTNCKFLCNEWGMGMEIDNNVKREEVERQVRELMEEKKGEEMREKAMEWKMKAKKVVEVGGSSWVNFERLVNNVLLHD